MKRRSFLKCLAAIVAAPIAFFKNKEVPKMALVSTFKMKSFSEVVGAYVIPPSEHQIQFTRLPEYWYTEETRIELVSNMDDNDPEKARQIQLMKEQYTTDLGKEAVAKLEASLHKNKEVS